MTHNTKIGRQHCPGCVHHEQPSCARPEGALPDLVPECLERHRPYAVCEHCEQPMAPGSSCSEWIDCLVDGRGTRPYRRKPWDGEQNCHDCNCRPGGFHHAGCDVERCPVCGDQFLLHIHNPYGGLD